jgi:hypothetical protein
METFVLDALVTLPWCFEDEPTAWTDGLLDRLRSGDQIAVPAHGPTEISSRMLIGAAQEAYPVGTHPELFSR